MHTDQFKPGEPYCSNCGYALAGCTESSKCPECGRPIVEVLSRAGRWGRRYRSEATLFGLPVIDIALGATPTERSGHARGIIAIGDKATGFLALGGMARGVVACGGMAIGLVSVGGLSIGLVAAMGGLAIGALADGGLSIGILAAGGLAAGYAAVGGLPVGYYAAGGAPIGVHRMGPGANSPEALNMMSQLDWFFGPPSFGAMNMIQPLLAIGVLLVGFALLVALLAFVGHARHGPAGIHPGR